jgi:hypothetical protein
LHTLFSGHAKGKAYDDLLNVIIPDETVKEGEIVLFVLSVKRLKTLSSNSQWVSNRDANAPRTNIKAQDAVRGR